MGHLPFSYFNFYFGPSFWRNKPLASVIDDTNFGKMINQKFRKFLGSNKKCEPRIICSTQTQLMFAKTDEKTQLITPPASACRTRNSYNIALATLEASPQHCFRTNLPLSC